MAIVCCAVALSRLQMTDYSCGVAQWAGQGWIARGMGSVRGYQGRGCFNPRSQSEGPGAPTVFLDRGHPPTGQVNPLRWSKSCPPTLRKKREGWGTLSCGDGQAFKTAGCATRLDSLRSRELGTGLVGFIDSQVPNGEGPGPPADFRIGWARHPRPLKGNGRGALSS